MQRLGHGAEVSLDARCKRSSKRQRLCGAINVEPEEVRCGGRGAEYSERGSGMPTFVVVVEVDGARQAHLGLDPDDVGGQGAAARHLERFTERENGCGHGCRVMTAQYARNVVVIEGV